MLTAQTSPRGRPCQDEGFRRHYRCALAQSDIRLQRSEFHAGSLTSAIGTTAQVAGPVAAQAIDSAGGVVGAIPGIGGGGVGQTAGGTQTGLNVTEQQVATAADTASTGLWRTFASLLLAMGAAVLGGFAGGKTRDKRTDEIHTTVAA